MKTTKILAAVILLFIWQGCNSKNKKQNNMEQDETALNNIFPIGEKGSAEWFTGDAYPTSLLEADSIYTTLAGNVYFEPGARSNWHTHPSGQILIITDGIGYFQIEGQPIEVMKKGDVVKFPPNIRHWHGASPDVGVQQLYIIPNTEQGIVEWMEAVTDEEYNKKS
ncbi:cupin domain-containing protein [Belliella sp. DSM 107340]|uniref:Cupin domain-containing protein n=1 Tax=Belliella calami TaxID=2923436 RepID=A0ABS9UK21_9BACT|nr:cupin domain-containing protein [Belliella calami]MCH7396780.1 cupin domain-containing protein [Belliella calami]